MAGIVGGLGSGLLCTVPIDNGWPLIFYLFGGVSTIWVILWAVFSSTKPENNHFISRQELEFIIPRRDCKDKGEYKKERPPYRQIFSSSSVWGLVLSGITLYWYTDFLVYYPDIFKNVLKFSVRDVGFIMVGNSVLYMLSNVAWTCISNKLSMTFDMNTTRKMCFVSGVTLCAASQVVVAVLVTRDTPFVILGLLVCRKKSGWK